MSITEYRAWWIHPESDSSGFEYFDATKGLNDIDNFQEILAIEQFTGLYDKKGNRIYEGDVIDGLVVTYCADSKESLGMQSGWYLQRDNFESWEPLTSRINENGDNYEIAGNIHQNLTI